MQHCARVYQQECAQAAHLAAAPPGTAVVMSDHMAKWTAELFEYANHAGMICLALTGMLVVELYNQ